MCGFFLVYNYLLSKAFTRKNKINSFWKEKWLVHHRFDLIEKEKNVYNWDQKKIMFYFSMHDCDLWCNYKRKMNTNDWSIERQI